VYSIHAGATDTADTTSFGDWFERGVSLYESGHFAQSAAYFEKILNDGAVSGPVYYNLGNAYFKLGSAAKARLMYERALRFMPRNTDLAGNLAFLKNNLEDKIELPTPSLAFKIYYWAGSLFNRTELAYLLIGLYLLGMLLWALLLLRTPFRHVITGILVCTAVIFVWSGSVFIYKVYIENQPVYAVTMPDEVPVRWGNTEQDKIAFYLHAGTKVIIRQQRGNWMLITIGDDKSGWVNRKDMEVI
jgi:tetratricopeptide (TPR) repeat protein